jgi:hypothetical protein
MTATNIMVLFLVLGYVAFCAWIILHSRQNQKRQEQDAGEDHQRKINRPERKSSGPERKAA